MKKLKTLFTVLMVIIMASGAWAQTSREYAVEDLAQLETDLAAGTYDVYILTTSGGIYDFTASNITIGADAVIKAAEGLAEKPVISRNGNTATDAGIFRTQNVTINLGLEGLILDGTVTSTTANQKVVALRAESTVHVKVDNSVFRNFTNINGVFRLQGAESSVDMRNSVFHDITQRVIQPWQVDVIYGHFNIDNCVFYNINGSIVWYRSINLGANLAIGSTLTVNHSTFHNINPGADGIIRGRDNNTGEVKILNSVFSSITEPRPLTNAVLNLTVDHSYFGDTPVGSAANDPVVTNILTTAPVYEDAAAFNFRITNADDLIAGTGDVAGVVWYYAPGVQPTLLVQNTTQVKVVFSRPVDQATAETLTNYTLSGTFGLTGNPTEATLVNDREVVLTVGDISDIPVDETIIVTVAGVEDIYGMAIGVNNTATFTKDEEIIPEVYLVTFTVTFDDDGTPKAVEGAEITITGVSGTLTTDADGKATIELENGTYTYSVDAADFVAIEDATFLVEDAPADVEVTLELIPIPDLYLVTFTVTFDDDATPEAIEGAQITITGITEVLTTNAEGVATIELENGTYTYIVEAAGFVSVVDASFEVEDGPADVDVTLELIPVPDVPTLSMSPQVVTNRATQRVAGTSDKTGFIVIVKEDAPQATLAEMLAAVDNKMAAKADVTVAGDNVNISTNGLVAGVYNGYAVDADDNVSEAVLAVVTVNDSQSREYTVEQIAEFQADLASGAYDAYIFATSGGVYDLTSYITITSDAVLRAAEGLAEKPVIMRTNNTSNGAGMFRIQTETVNITLEGLIFDGTVTGDFKVSGFRAESTAHFHVNNCVFRNFTEINGVFRLQATASSVDVRNSVFHDNLQRMIHLYTPDVAYGDVNIDNCLFYNISGPIVFTRTVSSVPAIGASLIVNHSTFNNITITTDGIFRGRNNNATGETKFMNSVFTNITAGPLAPQFPGVVLDYSYADGMDPKPSGTNLFTTAPVYEDAANNIFRITNADDFIVASGDIAGVTWYYAPRVNPALMVESATQVKVVFSRPVDETSAETVANYTLSGTFGLTGNPTAAELVNEREVLLTVADVSSIPVGETIVVTVAGVADTNGMVIADINNVAVYQQPLAISVIAEIQTLTNAPGQVAKVQSSLVDGYVFIVLENEPQATKAELEAAVAAGKGAFAPVTAALTDMEISVESLQPGVYFAYAVSADGDLSDKSTNSITITQDDTSTENIAGNSVRVFARNNTIYLQAPESLYDMSYEVFDIQGRKIQSGIINGSSQVETTRSGIYIVRFGDARILPVRIVIAQ